MIGETPKPWWQTIDDKPTIALARRLAGVFTGLPPDVMVLAYPPQIVRAPSCDATIVRIGDLAPLWTCYLGAARQAMAAQAELARLVPDIPVIELSMRQYWRTVRQCKLFDFERRVWVGFPRAARGGA